MNRRKEDRDEGKHSAATGDDLSSETSSNGSFGEQPLSDLGSKSQQSLEQRLEGRGAEIANRESLGQGGNAGALDISQIPFAKATTQAAAASIDSVAQQHQQLLENRRLQQQQQHGSLGLESILGGQLGGAQGSPDLQPQFAPGNFSYPATTGQFGMPQYPEPEMLTRQYAEMSRLSGLLDRQFDHRNAPIAEDILSRSTSNYNPYQQQLQLPRHTSSYSTADPGRGLLGDSLSSTRVGPLLAGYLPHEQQTGSQPLPGTYASAPSLQHQYNFNPSFGIGAQPGARMQHQGDLIDALRQEQALRNAWGIGSTAPTPPQLPERQQQDVRLQALLSEQRALENQLAGGANAIQYRNLRRNVPHYGHPEMLDSKLSPILPPRISQDADRVDRVGSVARGKRAAAGMGPSTKRSKATPATQSAAHSADQPRFTLAPGEGFPLSLPSDRGILSEYQQLIRQSIEFFEAQPGDISTGVQGRRKKIEVSQVGLRCRYCAHRPAHWRGRGAAYYPGTLACVYQAAQNMAANHFVKTCDDIPPDVHKKLVEARQKQEQETRRSGGKTYWMETSRHVGLEEREGKSGVWFRSS